MRLTKPATNKRMILRIVVLSVAAALLGGCASREAGPSSTVTQRRSPDAVELLAQSRSAARTFETRLGLAVAAADLAAKAIANGGGNEDRTLYNNACTEVAVLSRKFALPLTLKTPAGNIPAGTRQLPNLRTLGPFLFQRIDPHREDQKQDPRFEGVSSRLWRSLGRCPSPRRPACPLSPESRGFRTGHCRPQHRAARACRRAGPSDPRLV